MINSLRLINFQDVVECQDLLHKSRESFLPINYELNKGNVYGFISDFGCGSWGITTCLGGRTTQNYSGKILLNNNEIQANQLSNYSCFVTEKIFPNINSLDNMLTPETCIKKALAVSGQTFSVSQIKDIFCLSDGRFKRPLSEVSGEIWLISLAVNFALGKDIFCYPWLNQLDIERFKTAYEHNVIDFLKKENKIIIVPSSQKRILRRYCDHMIIFDKEKLCYR